MEGEVRAQQEGGPPGPMSARWLNIVADWQSALRRRFVGDPDLVTGAWRVCEKQWLRRAERMPPERAKEVMDFVRHGIKAPFATPPAQPVRTLRNHRDLGQQKQLVWDTLREQLRESAIRPWAVHEGLPRGMFALRWVQKGDTGAIRLTVNMRPLNAYFRPEASEVKLDT